MVDHSHVLHQCKNLIARSSSYMSYNFSASIKASVPAMLSLIIFFPSEYPPVCVLLECTTCQCQVSSVSAGPDHSRLSVTNLLRLLCSTEPGRASRYVVCNRYSMRPSVLWHEGELPCILHKTREFLMLYVFYITTTPSYRLIINRKELYDFYYTTITLTTGQSSLVVVYVHTLVNIFSSLFTCRLVFACAEAHTAFKQGVHQRFVS